MVSRRREAFRHSSPAPQRAAILFLTLLGASGAGLWSAPALATERLVPVSNATLLRIALSAAEDGDIIELADGVYSTASAGPFLIQNPGAHFTIRAANPGAAILDGGNTERIVDYFVGDAGAPGWVVFEGIVFRNGRTLETGKAGGVHLRRGRATFVDSVFQSNRAVPAATSGASAGAVQMTTESTAIFDGCTFTDNTSDNHGGAMLVGQGSTVVIVDSQFISNRNNVPGHRANGLGGAIHVFNALAGTTTRLAVANTLFRNNEASFVGGAIQIKGNYAHDNGGIASPTEVLVVNSTFEDNTTAPRPEIEPSLTSPTEGGAIMLENNVSLEIHHSRFYRNSAGLGGALSSNRSSIIARASEFRDNFAFGRPSPGQESNALGGAIKLHSNDLCSFPTNIPTASLEVTDSFFENNRANLGGGIQAGGDLVRQYGGCPLDTPAQNRAPVTIRRTIFTGCTVDNSGPATSNALGGALYTNLADVTVEDSLFIDSHAEITAPSPITIAGGAAAFRINSRVQITGSTFARNSAEAEGGALHFWGGEIAGFSDNAFIENAVLGDGGATPNASRGAAIYVGPDPSTGGGLDIFGSIDDSIFTDNVGIPIWERDETCPNCVRNLVTYDGNVFHNTTFGDDIFYNQVDSQGVTSAELNTLIVNRGGGDSTDKSPTGNNGDNGSTIAHAALLAAPPRILQQAAAGETGPSEACIAWAWSGGCAELDGTLLDPVTELTGFSSVGPSSSEILSWNGACAGTADAGGSDVVTSQAPTTAVLTADPVAITSGGSSTLTWQTGGQSAPLGGIVSHDVADFLPAAGTGTVVTPAATTRYRLVRITSTGGAVDVQGVFVDQEPDVGEVLFADGFESGDTSAWN